jgi:putative ABC transport system permease protein
MNARTWQIVSRSLRILWRYPLRSILVMVIAGTGVAGVVCSVNYAASGTNQLLDQIRRMGTNVLIISPAQSRVIAGRARSRQPVTTLVERDYLAIRRELLSRTRSSAFVTASFWLKSGDLSKNSTVLGCEPDYFAIRNWQTVEGEVFREPQERTASRVVLLGHTAARDIFGDRPPIGERLLINRAPFTVIGVLSERGQGLDVSNEDNQVYVPLSTAMRRLLNVDHYSGIVLEIDSPDSMDLAASQTRSLLHQLHHVQPDQPDDFQIQNQKALLDTRLASARRLNFLVRWIGSSALVVSALGMLGITWIAAKERTREFGTRRALGATARDIFVHILSETTALALAGCSAGVFTSWPLSRFIVSNAGLVFVYKGDVAVAAFAAALVLNITFALLPSAKAARLRPTETLRYE